MFTTFSVCDLPLLSWNILSLFEFYISMRVASLTCLFARSLGLFVVEYPVVLSLVNCGSRAGG